MITTDQFIELFVNREIEYKSTDIDFFIMKVKFNSANYRLELKVKNNRLILLRLINTL
jgi:hypothetical protein